MFASLTLAASGVSNAVPDVSKAKRHTAGKPPADRRRRKVNALRGFDEHIPGGSSASR
jgi:hypothetical protein